MDVTSRESFDKLNYYFQEISRYGSRDVKVLVIATKSDDSSRCVLTQEILDVVEKLKQEEEYKDQEIQFIETSAKNNYNVSLAVETIVRTALRSIMETDPITPPLNNDNNQDKARCLVM